MATCPKVKTWNAHAIFMILVILVGIVGLGWMYVAYNWLTN